MKARIIASHTLATLHTSIATPTMWVLASFLGTEIYDNVTPITVTKVLTLVVVMFGPLIVPPKLKIAAW